MFGLASDCCRDAAVPRSVENAKKFLVPSRMRQISVALSCQGNVPKSPDNGSGCVVGRLHINNMLSFRAAGAVPNGTMLERQPKFYRTTRGEHDEPTQHPYFIGRAALFGSGSRRRADPAEVGH